MTSVRETVCESQWKTLWCTIWRTIQDYLGDSGFYFYGLIHDKVRHQVRNRVVRNVRSNVIWEILR